MTRKELRTKLDANGFKEAQLRRTKAGVFQIILPVYRNPKGRIEGEGNTWDAAYAMFQRSNHR